MTETRVLITGVTGFAGSHLAERCVSDGLGVLGVSRSGTRLAGWNTKSFSRLTVKKLDLEDADAVERLLADTKPEIIFHLSAKASVAESLSRPKETILRNLSSSLNLLEASRKYCPEARIVVACSGEEYGPVPAKSLPVTEETPLKPQNPYALSKTLVDLLCSFYRDAHDMHISTARAFNHIGPRQSDTYVASSFSHQIAATEIKEDVKSVKIVTGNTEARRDFTDVRDVVRAYVLIANKDKPGVYNVCSGRSLLISELLETLSSLTEIEVKNEVDPKLLRENEVMEITGSNDKLRRATGWKPEIQLKKSMQDSLEWWRRQLRKG